MNRKCYSIRIHILCMIKYHEFVFNKLAYISEQYAYELQKYNYKNGLIIKKQLSENNFDVTENQVYSVYQE